MKVLLSYFTMNSSWWLRTISFFTIFDYICSSPENRYTFTQGDGLNETSVFCSSASDDTSTYSKLLYLLNKNNASDVVGIYKRSDKTAQLCYSKMVESGQVTLATLSDGKMFGKLEYSLKFLSIGTVTDPRATY